MSHLSTLVPRFSKALVSPSLLVLLAFAPFAYGGVPLITAATIDPATNTIHISGSNLLGSDDQGVFSVTLGGTSLTPGAATTTSIIATFPGATPASSFVPGTYQLAVRFYGSTAPGTVFFNVVVVAPQTRLLYSVVTNQGGFDTSITIANVSLDPVTGSPATAGACILYFLGGPINPPPFSTGSIAGGTVYANTVSSMAPGFQGYVSARCGFKAQGVAIGSDVGARNLAWSVPAIINP